MKVTFLIPPVLDGTQDVDRCFGCNYSIYFLPLLPVLYSATVLKGVVDSVVILDFPAMKRSIEEFKEFIKIDDSDIYIFYTVFLSQETDKIARDLIRKQNRKAIFIFSGPQPTHSSELFLDKPDTFAVTGEPELVIKELVWSLINKHDISMVKGVVFFDGSRIIHNPASEIIADLDLIPIPDRTLLDHSPYLNPKLHRLPHTAILTSRGCFGQCWYCVPNSLSYARELQHKDIHGRKPPARIHSAKRVVDEFKSISELGFRSVSVIDDQFIWDEPRTIEICQGIKDLGLEWSCLSRPEMITEKIAKAMSEAGCVYVDMGTESFDPEVLKAIRKDMTPQDTRRAAGILKRNNIGIEINVLIGATPKETEQSINMTLREVKKLDADYVLFSIANPFPGTDFYNAAKKEGWLYYGKYVPTDPAKTAIISYPHLSKQKLERLCAKAYLSYYLSPRYLARQFFKLKGFKDFCNKLKTAVNFFIKNFLKK